MTQPNRRRFLQAAGAVGLAGMGISTPRLASAAERRKRKFTMDLRCGSIGVRADLPQAISYAHQYGFESVEPSAHALARLSKSELDEVTAELKEKGLVWGAAGMPVNFRGDEARFQEGTRQLPELAEALQRAGVSRVGTWLSPTSNALTYVANFRQHARRLREVAKILGDHGQRFGLEYVGPKTSWTRGRFPFIHTMAETKDLLAEIDLLSLTCDDVVACDLNDAPSGIPIDEQQDGSRELPAATSVIDLKTFLGALVTIGYDGPVRAEPFNKALTALDNEEALAQTAAAMKKAFALVE
ncbi:MAG: sugar phosphate isomerase/epimerase family protein [Planctomycetota bacterium]|jgi:sugar phosphate isomerase/epimerase